MYNSRASTNRKHINIHCHALSLSLNTHARTFGAMRLNILAKITWPVRAKRIWLRNVENHITHSKSATSCSKRRCICDTWHSFPAFCICGETSIETKYKEAYHFPAKVMPSWLHAFFEGLSVYVLWREKNRTIMNDMCEFVNRKARLINKPKRFQNILMCVIMLPCYLKHFSVKSIC